MKMYPQLAVKDSIFNKLFRDLYTEELQKNPGTLTQADWPLILAHRTAALLTVKPANSIAPGTPAPSVAENRIRATPTPASSLDRGAYNQRRSPYWWAPWVRYY